MGHDCEKCNEHAMVIKEMGNNTTAIDKLDKRAWQGIILLFCILLSSLLTMGSTAYFALNSKVQANAATRYQGSGVTHVTPNKESK